MDRKAKATRFLHPTMKGIEIGPLHNGIAPRREGWQVMIVDHLPTEQLKEKYRAHKGVKLDAIESVDIVWRSPSLVDGFPGIQVGQFDFIIASHVIEHLPNLLSFFRDAQRLLKPGGFLSLIVPDKRYCFDLFKPLSTTADLLEASLGGVTRHSRRATFQNIAYHVLRGGRGDWDARQRGSLEFAGDLLRAHRQMLAYDESAEAEHRDFHRWYFTPSSFKLVLLELACLQLVNFEIVAEFPTAGCEFYTTLRSAAVPAPPPSDPAAINGRRLALLTAIEDELAAGRSPSRMALSSLVRMLARTPLAGRRLGRQGRRKTTL